MERVEFQHTMATKDMEEYLGNPINAFKLIKRVVRDWGGVNDVLGFQYAHNELSQQMTQLKQNSNLPDESDLKRAVLGLARLQDIYNLNTTDMANGKGYGSSLTWRECFEISTILFHENRYELALNWLQITMAKLKPSQETEEIRNQVTHKIQESRAYILHAMGEPEEALKYLDEIMVNDRSNYLRLTKKYLNKRSKDNEPNGKYKNHDKYTRLCRDEITYASHLRRTLKCHMDSSIHPFFVLSPLQVESIHLNPPVTVVHNILNDKQIQALLSGNQENSKRSQNFKDSTNNNAKIVENSKLQLKTTESAAIAIVNRFVSLLAGISMKSSKKLHIFNHDIGGQYQAYYDYFKQLQTAEGDRITANLFYLSDVEMGGLTIFPKFNVTVRPVKGSMLMWFNHHDILEPGAHVECPVLKGSKTVAYIWSNSSKTY